MRFFKNVFLVLFLYNVSVFSQEKYKQHTVLKGETISEIAQFYSIKINDIYELNPDAIHGIKTKMVLLLPTKTKKNSALAIANQKVENTFSTHEVLSKETLYGIAKQYKISLEELYKINPNLEKEGLKIGQKINVPQTNSPNLVLPSKFKKDAVSKNAVVEIATTEEKTITTKEGFIYEVLPKESLYSIAKKHDIKILDLQKANPTLGSTALKVGQKISIPKTEVVTPDEIIEKKIEKKDEKLVLNPPAAEKPIPVSVEQQVVAVQTLGADFIHEILPKESLYSLSKQYGISVSDLQKANPLLENKTLRVGQKVIVPAKTDANSIAVVVPKETKVVPKKTEKNFPKSEKDIPETEIKHQVLPKETKYGIAKSYGITVAELENQNPSISKKMLVGSVLTIRSKKVVEHSDSVPKEVVLEEFPQKETENSTPPITRDAAFVEQLILAASQNIGTPYRYGGTTQEGFDCSGLMCFAYGSLEVKLPRSSIEMASYGSKIDAENTQKGDLIFFKTNGSSRVNHVGMVVEVLEGEIKFIHSSTHGGVMISSTKEEYYAKCVAQVNRVL